MQKKLLKFIFRELKSVQIINPYLDELDVLDLFEENSKQIKQFLRITSLITLLHQKQLGMKKNGNHRVVEVQPKHMLVALELFQSLWFQEDEELSFQVASTLSRIKEELKKTDKENYKDLAFTVKEMRAKLGAFPSTFSRHINALYDYNKLERVGGKKNTGYEYSVISWTENTSADKFNNFKKEINSL